MADAKKNVLSDSLATDRVPVVDPKGRLGSVKRDEYEKALASGYRFQSPEEQEKFASQLKYGERPIAAGAAGVARGVSVGLSDVAGPDLGIVSRETLKGLQEENEVASTVGDVAGSLISPVNKIGGGVERGFGAVTRLGRIGAKAVGGAAVGSLFGAGNAVSDAALDDHPLTAESLVAHMGLGAVLGFGGGGIGAGIEEGASALLPKLGKSIGGAQSILDDIADDAAVKSTRATQAEIARIGEANVEALGPMMRARGHLQSPVKMLETMTADREAIAKTLLKQMGFDVELPHGLGQEDAQAAFAKHLDKYGKIVGDSLGDIDASAKFPGGARPIYSRVLSRLDDLEASAPDPAAADKWKGPIDEARAYINKMASSPVDSPSNGFKALNSLKSTLMKDINYAAESSVKTNIKKQIAHIIREEIDTQLEQHAGAGVTKEFLDAKRAYGILSRGEEALGRKTSTAADAISEMATHAKLTTPEVKLFDLLGHGQSLASKGATRTHGLGLKDLVFGGIIGGGHIGGIPAAIASKFMREHGQAIIARVADAASKSPALATVAASLGKALPNVVPKMGQYGPALMQALQSGPHAALALHLVQSQVDPGYSATATLAGLTPEEPEQHVAALERAHGVASVAATLSKHQRAVDEGIGHVVKGTKPPATTAPTKAQDFGSKQMRGASTSDAHRRRVDEVRRLATDPQALVDRVSKNAGGTEQYAPTVISSLTATAQRAVTYLAKEAEEPPKAGPLAREWTPTDAERHVWMRKLEVVTEPMALLRIAAEGRLTRTQLDAVQAVYPALASDIRDHALNALVSGEKMPYRARMMLGMLAGVDADGSMSSKAIAANQQAIQTAGKKPSEEMGAPPKSSVEDMTLASRSAMPGEQRALKQGVGNG